MKARIAFFVACVLVASQLALPSLAERRVRSELAAFGDVTSVEVSAFPALKLLFQRADSVRVRMSRAEVGTGDLADQLVSTERTGELDFTVDSLSVGPLEVRDVTLRKDGDELIGSAALTDDLPLDLRPVSTDGDALILEASLAGVTARARLSAVDGALRVAPDGLLGGFASVTVFEDPRVAVESVDARSFDGGFTTIVRGTLRS